MIMSYRGFSHILLVCGLMYAQVHFALEVDRMSSVFVRAVAFVRQGITLSAAV